MDTNTFFIPNEDGSRTVILGSSCQAKSTLADLTPAEISALNDWSTTQTGDPQRGGAINLMEWPGWGDVLRRRIQERASPANAVGSGPTQSEFASESANKEGRDHLVIPNSPLVNQDTRFAGARSENLHSNRLDAQGQFGVDPALDAERERWTSHLLMGMRTMRKYGFYVAQDPDATRQDREAQMSQAIKVACVLLNVPATPANMWHELTQAIARELLDHTAVAAERLRTV